MTGAYAFLIRWAEQQPLVRAMLLTSSRAIPNGPADSLSDYDVILVLSDVHPFHDSRDWLAAFGRVLALYQDPLETDDGALKSGNVVQFESGLKIDFSLWEPAILQRIADSPRLPPEFDAGYLVLLDKDGLTARLAPPTYRGYIPAPPNEAEYQKTIQEFFLEAGYVARYLRRDDVMAAKFILDTFMKHEHLRPMLEWHYEIAHDWSVKPGLYGRRMRKWLRPDLWAALEKTYTGAGLEENWQALHATIALLHATALEVGERLGFTYPIELERRMTAYIEQIKHQEEI